MKINNNMSAVITNKQLLRTENKLTASMERLSSGLKLNHAKDNPAGMAISNKMKAQIDALDRASSNASDGISVLNIADGALNETSSILQRMRELSVQAANGTNGIEDLQAIQAEIDSLKEEVTRISTDTEYNSMSLLDGSLDTRVYAKNVTRINVSDYVEPGDYKLTITAAAKQAEITDGAIDKNSDVAIGEAGVVSINGSWIEIEATDTQAQVYEKLRNAAELGEATLETADDGRVTGFKSTAYGADASLKVTFTTQELADALGFTVVEDTENENFVIGTKGLDDKIEVPEGTDAKVELQIGENPADPTDVSKFTTTATVKAEGNKITVTDKNGFSLSFLASAGFGTDPDFATDPTKESGKIALEVTDIGTMTLQIGANKDQNMEVRIPEISSESLYIEEVNVTTVTGADRAITTLDEAIAQLSSARSRIGAYQNRLDYAVSSLDTFEENMTGAMSRLTDVDMAEEMTTYTQQNVLSQAGISVLTQANDMPQQVLQLLQ